MVLPDSKFFRTVIRLYFATPPAEQEKECLPRKSVFLRTTTPLEAFARFTSPLSYTQMLLQDTERHTKLLERQLILR